MGHRTSTESIIAIIPASLRKRTRQLAELAREIGNAVCVPSTRFDELACDGLARLRLSVAPSDERPL
jgi:hypothetical protein